MRSDRIRLGVCGYGNLGRGVEASLDQHPDMQLVGVLGSNPEFTAAVLVAYARAAYRLAEAGQFRAKTVYDIAPGLLSTRSAEELRAGVL